MGITCALIPVSTPGVEIGGRHFPLNAAFQNGPTRGKDVFIPLEWVIGGRAGIGQGWRMLMECLAAGRGISLPACATSAAQLAARATGAYARIRRQFRLPIGRFEAVEDVLARIAGLTWLADAGRRLTLSALMRGEHPSVASAILKYRLTEDMRRVLNDAMDVHGGRGICMGPRNYLARAYQCIPVTITVEGANLLTRGMIVFGQGAIRCHPWLREEMEAALDPDRERGMARFDRALMGHARYMLGNLARSLTSGLTNGRYAASPAHGALAPHARQIARLSAAFAFLADASLMLLGGSLKRREKLSGRFADALACLYLASAALKRFHDDGCPEADLPLAQWALTHCAEGCESALSGILDNYPLRGVAWLLRRIVMPLGRRCAAPSDRLGAQVAATLLTPSDTRDRLTGGIHLTDDPADPLGRLEHALFAVLRADDLERRLAERGERRSGTQSVEDWCAGLVARGLVTADEATHLLNADTAMRDAIAVDEFTPEALRGERAKEPALWNAREAAHG